MGRTPERGADTAVYLASDPQFDQVTGKYYDTRKDTRSSTESYDTAIAQQLWTVGETMTGLK